MSKEQSFIDKISPIVVKYAKEYGYKYPSAVIGQMCLESAYGTSELAVNANNFSGLKYKSSVTSQYYIKQATEQREDGSYYVVNDTKWCKASNLEEGIEMYFKFINNSRYANLKNATSSKNYLELIKQDGYATSLKYVDNVYNVVSKFNLEKYDEVEEAKTNKCSNSPLVDYILISPNKTIMTNKVNRKITIHHMAGNLSVETCGKVFQPTSRKASSNYGISNGRVGMYVEEKDRAWTSSSRENDEQAITIEVANDIIGGNWHISDKDYNKLIELCVDICKRNRIEKLVWTGDKNGTLTCHYFFAATSCPGPYLKSKMPQIAEEVNKRLNPSYKEPVLEDKEIIYIVQKGDTLSKIASKYNNVTYQQIAKWNNISNPNVINIGQKLKIKTKVEKEETETYSTYVVQSGDSLYKISKTFLGDGNRYREIMQLNNLKTTTIHPGQTLKIPK